MEKLAAMAGCVEPDCLSLEPRQQAEELERLRRALGEARDTFDKMGKAIAETCPATFAQEIAVCKLSCDEISAALRETKAAPEQEQA